MEVAIIIAAIVVVVLLAAGVYVYTNQQKHERLRRQFGPEYEHAVRSNGRRDAEKELERRTERVQRLRIRELDSDERRRFAEEWRILQARFVDAPAETIGEADHLVQEVMDRRGYPVTDFEQQAADLSVEHPNVVRNYRAAHAVAEAHAREGVSTEDLRRALINYRALFSDLLGEVPSRT